MYLSFFFFLPSLIPTLRKTLLSSGLDIYPFRVAARGTVACVPLVWLCVVECMDIAVARNLGATSCQSCPQQSNLALHHLDGPASAKHITFYWYVHCLCFFYQRTSESNRLRPSTSSSPAFNSPPGSLKNVVPSCSKSTCGKPCSCTKSTPSTERRMPIRSNSSLIRWKRDGTDGSFSKSGSLVPNV